MRSHLNCGCRAVWGYYPRRTLTDDGSGTHARRRIVNRSKILSRILLAALGIAAATQLAGRVREEIPAACAREKVGGWERITVTIGIAAFPGDGEDVDTLMRVADRRMYSGKKAGRDRVVSA